ncbi:Transposon Tf2-6 polyprotein [Exaiptasia diaphana]|nr:Transposon Tf2-6 polyprotein [Exaiptasia diaphana]
MHQYEVRSLLGMTNYSARFIPNYATITKPLRDLIKQGVTFTWSAKHQQALNAWRDALKNTTATSYFDPEKDTEILTDASTVGIAAVLTQTSGADGKTRHIIAYASTALTDVEQRCHNSSFVVIAIIYFLNAISPIKVIQGLRRETVIGLVANIKSQELQRREYHQKHIPPEHPRASTTDDVEGFIGVLHDLLGPIFDHKTFLDQMPKICNEYYKRMDPNLPFYYWTSYKDQFTAAPLPYFNLPSPDSVERRLIKSRYHEGLTPVYLWPIEDSCRTISQGTRNTSKCLPKNLNSATDVFQKWRGAHENEAGKQTTHQNGCCSEKPRSVSFIQKLGFCAVSVLLGRKERMRLKETTSWKVRPHTKVCSEHFLEADFTYRGIEETTSINNEVQELEDRKNELQKENLRLTAEVTSLKEKITAYENKETESKFTYERFKNSSQDIRFYTSFSSSHVFDSCFDFLNPGLNSENINYWKSSTQQANEQISELDIDEDDSDEEVSPVLNYCKQGRKRTLDAKTEFFMFLCRVRQGFRERHLAHLFHVSLSTVCRIVITWSNYVYLRLGSLNIWPDRATIDSKMPDTFKKKYPNCRVIIDCTELKVQTPSSMVLGTGPKQLAKVGTPFFRKGCIVSRAVDLAETLKKRLQSVVDKKSFSKVEQERFDASVGMGKELKKRINSFLYGGHIYMQHIKASKQFDGLLDLKVKSSKRGDVVFLRELQIIFDEVNALVTFLSLGHEKVLSFINCRGNITRKFNTDRQAKGTEGLKTRKSAKHKRIKNLKLLGEAPRVFVPLANVLIEVESVAVREEKDIDSTMVSDGDSIASVDGWKEECDFDQKTETYAISSSEDESIELSKTQSMNVAVYLIQMTKIYHKSNCVSN